MTRTYLKHLLKINTFDKPTATLDSRSYIGDNADAIS